MSTPEGMFGVPRSVIPDDLYSMLVKAKTRDWQLPGRGNLTPKQRRRAWVVAQLMIIRPQMTMYEAWAFYDEHCLAWLEA